MIVEMTVDRHFIAKSKMGQTHQLAEKSQSTYQWHA